MGHQLDKCGILARGVVVEGCAKAVGIRSPGLVEVPCRGGMDSDKVTALVEVVGKRSLACGSEDWERIKG